MSSWLQTWWRQPSGGREVLRLAFPLIVASISWTLMLFIDRMFLLWHSKEAMGAALPAALIWFTLICFPLGICTFVNTFVSQYHGAKRPWRIGPTVWQGVWVAVFTTPLLMAATPVVSVLITWADHAPEITRMEISYFQIIGYSTGGMLVSAALSSFFTGRGLTTTVMFVDTAAAGLNIALDALWIFGLAGFPEMGIAGAAYATVVSVWFKTAVYAWLFLRARNRVEFQTLTGFRIDRELLGRLLRHGSPAGAQFFLEIAGFTFFAMMVGRLGTLPQVATNLAFNVNGLAFMPVLGLGIAVSTMVGQRQGEGRDDLAARATWSSLMIALPYMAIVSSLYVLAPDWLLMAHLSSVDSADAGRLRETTITLLRFVAVFNLFDGMNVIFVGALKGAGDTRFVMVVSLIMAVLLSAAMLAALGPWELGVKGCWSIVTAWICMIGVIYLLRFLQGRWRRMCVIESVADAPSPAPESAASPALAGETE